MELDGSSKEGKAKRPQKKDIRSGREYYEGWDKYVSHWEKENTTEEKLDKEGVAKELSKETFTDPVAQNNNRDEGGLEAKPLIEREWLANREREKGNDLFKAKEFNASLQAYTKAISMYKDNTVLYANRAAVYLKMNRNEEAYADCTEALKLDPQNVKEVLRAVPGEKNVASQLKKMQMELNNGQLFLPKREGPMIIEEIPEEIEELHDKRSSKGSSGHLQPPGRDQGLQEATINSENDTAYVHTQESFAKNSSSHVRIPCTGQDMQEASMTTQKIHGDSKIQECFTTNDNSHVQNNRKDQGYLQTKLCASELKSGSSISLQTSNGECPEKQHEAVQERLRGNLYFKGGQYVEAIACYNKSLELDQTVAATYINRALCHLRLKHPGKAIDDCTQAIFLEPQNSKAYYRRAVSRQQMKDHIGALEDFKMLMSLCPDDGSIKIAIKELESEVHRQTVENGWKEPAATPCDASYDLVEVEKHNTTKMVSVILQNPDKWRTKNITGTPKSALEFERSCLDLLKQPMVLKKYIQAINTNLYPTIFKEDLTARLMKLVGGFLKENIALFDSKEIFDILEGFSRVRRFQIVVMFLETCGREAIKELFEHLTTTMDPSNDANDLRCKYLCC